MPAANCAPSTIWIGDNLAILQDMNSFCENIISLDPLFNYNPTYMDHILPRSKPGMEHPIT